MLISPAFAQAAGAPAGGGAGLLQGVVPLILIFVVFWFLIIRPQNKKMKEHRTKIDAVKKGDQVVTGGGLVGKVVKVDEGFVEVELGQNVKVRAVKSTLTDVIDPALAKAAND